MATVVYAARLPDEPPRASSLRVVAPACNDPWVYWQGFVDIWPHDGPIINVEHDMEYSDTLAGELLACPHPRCSWAYQCHNPRTFWAHSHEGRGMSGAWVAAGTEWAAYSAIGFCKIAAEARDPERPPSRATWQGVEGSVNAVLPGAWHLHWREVDGVLKGVEHYHYRDE